MKLPKFDTVAPTNDTVALTDLVARLRWEYNAFRSAIRHDTALLNSIEDGRHAIESLDRARDKLKAAESELALASRAVH